MTKAEIIQKAIHVYYPKFDKPETSQKEVDNVKSFNLPYVDLRYKGMNSNEHHFTTEYHNKYVLPFYAKLFGIKYSSDWVLTKKIAKQGKKEFDLSYLAPKKDKSFHIRCLGKKCEYDCKFSGLLYNARVKNVTWITPYHELYCLPHLCSVVYNKSENNGKKLLLIGDSQSVPDIAFLAYYFKEVWYIDNRDGISVTGELNSHSFDCVLFAQNLDDDNYYLDFIK